MIEEILKKWLMEYGKADITEITTESIEAMGGGYAIYKTPQRSEKKYLDGSKEITEHYSFFTRRNSQLDEECIDNNIFLEELADWIEGRDIDEDYPQMPEGMMCEEISVDDNSILLQEDKETIYQLTIAITYLKER